MKANKEILSWLLGESRARDFMRTCWGKKAVHVPSAMRSSAEGPVMTLEDLDEVLAFSISKDEDSGSSRAEPLVIIENRKQGEKVIASTCPYDRYAKGDTLVFNSVHRRHTAVGELCQAVGDWFKCGVVGNAYLTPQDAQGFPAHYDTHDVFVVQLHGEKTWRVGKSVYFAHPQKRHGLTVGVDSRELDDDGVELTLEPGDVLYIPRGVLHEASTSPLASSLHLTIAVKSHTIEDLLLAAVKLLADRDESLRRSLPLDFEAESIIKEIVERVQFNDADLLEEAEANIRRERIDEASALPRGRFAAIDLAKKLTPTSRVSKRRGATCALEQKDEQPILKLPGSGTLAAPRAAHQTLAHVARMKTRSIRVCDLPGALTDDSKKLLVRRLMELGVLS